MGIKTKSDSDLIRVLEEDGVPVSELDKYENCTTVNLQELRDDENWVILDGEWEWWIEGVGTQRVKTHDIIVVPRGVWHKITCVGDSPGVRYAVTRPDVEHVYEDG